MRFDGVRGGVRGFQMRGRPAQCIRRASVVRKDVYVRRAIFQMNAGKAVENQASEGREAPPATEVSKGPAHKFLGISHATLLHGELACAGRNAPT